MYIMAQAKITEITLQKKRFFIDAPIFSQMILLALGATLKSSLCLLRNNLVLEDERELKSILIRSFNDNLR